MSVEPAASLLHKLQRFASLDLDASERILLGVLLAPGVTSLLRPSDVEGFEMSGVGTETSIRALEDALIDSTLRIVSVVDEHDVAGWPEPSGEA